MSIAEKVAAHLPYLRRFARSVTGSQKSGDAYVVSTLEAILADPRVFTPNLQPRVALFRTFVKILNSIPLNTEKTEGVGNPALDAAKRNLETLVPMARQAFLLVAVEEFQPHEVAQIMDVPPGVVIIEDEPLIALDLEQLVTDLGHRVVKIARTAQQAVEAVKQHKPGLVLADIHLADGSSGLDAVNEILQTFSLPVIFVTAYPQRLLTGTRPEPTFLITKPFHPDNVKAVISQALFFDIRGRPEQPSLASV